jgi:hypothetical protein
VRQWALLVAALTMILVETADGRPRWTVTEANTWYASQPWIIGSNYLPASAINQLEMWQADTFDPARIELEFGWAQSIGMNTMRVFLHDLLWKTDRVGFMQRLQTFLAIAHRHGIKPLFVLFDSCWDPLPEPGPQHAPVPGVHNSGWVQSPGTAALSDPEQYPRLEAYVKGIIGAFRSDERILGWDLWNEPDNPAVNYPAQPANKVQLVTRLLPQVFRWARSVEPIQPLTSGLWLETPRGPAAPYSTIENIQLTESDILTFHNYSWPESLQTAITQLKIFGRPVICTEFMARGVGSTLDSALPIGRQANVGMINWGFVDGKEQTRLPWDSWKHPYVEEEPPVWFHDLLHTDGSPYRQAELDLIRRTVSRAKTPEPHQ